MRCIASMIVLICCVKWEPCEGCTETAIFSSLEGRVIKPGYKDKAGSTGTKSMLNCIQFLCAGRFSKCAVSYNNLGRQCISTSVSGWLISWNPDLFTDIDPSWSTFISKSVPQFVDRPAVLYLLDNVNKGIKLGSKGSDVDLIETGLIDWSEQGPRGDHSHLKYLISGETNRAEIPYKMTNGLFRFDFTQQFTITSWVKTDTSVTKDFPILEGLPQGTAPDFAFSPSKNQDQLRMAPRFEVHAYISALNATGKQFWRHVAAVYKGFKDVQFYLNGSSFGPTLNSYNQDEILLPERQKFGNKISAKQFLGTFACLTIHEKALSQAEIEALMAVCP